MKIAVFAPKADFSKENQKLLNSIGKVVFTKARQSYPITELKRIASGAEIIALDPDAFGGFEKAKKVVTEVANSLPNLKYVTLITTAYGWVDTEYFKKRGIFVSNIPGYSRESVAEHTIALLLGLAKRILVTDRKTQKGKYKLEMGFELKGKTLGIIGLGNIGGRVGEIAQGIGMKVIAYNPSPRKQKGIEMKSLDEVIKESDAITLHTRDSEEVENLINAKTIAKMKNRVILVNTVDRGLVDEKAMAEAIKKGKVFGYAYEAEDLKNTPLSAVENAIGIKGFGWFTTEAIENLFKICVDNISSFLKGRPINVVNK